MRLVQVMVPTGKREAVVDVLEEEGVDYALTDEVSGRKYTAVVTFPLPTEAVEPVLEALREAGVERDAYTVVTNAETVISRKFEELQERYAAERDEDRIAREELVARVEDLAPDRRTYFVLTVVSAVVATAGLLLDSPAVVVGSMVIAPLVGPAMSTGVGTVVDERDLFVRGVRLQVVGGLLAVTSAGAFAYLLHASGAVPMDAAGVFGIGEVSERLAPDVLSLAVALAAGIAGAISLSTGVSTALVGVMIAAALVPPTAVVGIGIAWGEPTAVLGSAVLVLVNFLSVNFAALAVLWYSGYRPQSWFREDEARRQAIRRAGVLLVGILVLSAFLVGVTYASTRTATFERRTQATVAADVAGHEDVSLLAVDVVYDGGFDLRSVERLTLRRPERVVVTVGHPPGVDPPPLADALDRRVGAVARRTLGTPPPTVEVRFVVVETADGPAGA
ncbi:MAG: TIGR00341 family protein [Haloferacaceae archaeon]